MGLGAWLEIGQALFCAQNICFTLRYHISVKNNLILTCFTNSIVKVDAKQGLRISLANNKGLANTLVIFHLNQTPSEVA